MAWPGEVVVDTAAVGVSRGRGDRFGPQGPHLLPEPFALLLALHELELGGARARRDGDGCDDGVDESSSGPWAADVIVHTTGDAVIARGHVFLKKGSEKNPEHP